MTLFGNSAEAETAVPPSTGIDGSTISSEEFPLQEPRALNAVESPSPESVNEKSIKETKIQSKSKRFSLRSIARPFVNAAKFNLKSSTKPTSSSPKELKSARKSLEGKKESRETRRVSFSPSTTDEASSDARDEALRKSKVTDYRDHGEKGNKKKKKKQSVEIQRSSSFDDSIGRRTKVSTRKRAVSFTWDKSGVHVTPDTEETPPEARQVRDKSRMSAARITKQQAIAARHARALEQIINAGASLEIGSVEVLKAKREKKTGGKLDKTKVQMIPAVSPRKVLSLKRALLDSEMANGIIGELRFMQLDERTISPSGTFVVSGQAASQLEEVIGKADEKPRKTVRPAPIKAICLDCTEEEADRRQREIHSVSQTSSSTEEEKKRVLSEGGTAISTAAAASVVGIWGLGGFFKAKETTSETTTITDSQGHQLSKTTVTNVKTPASEAMQYAREFQDDVANGDVSEAMADLTRISVVALKQAQPLAGTVAETVEERLLPVNKELPNETATISVTSTTTSSSSPGMLSGVSPISLIMTPVSGAASLGMNRVGAYDALGTLSGFAVQVANGGAEGMDEIHPPLDRMAIFIRWWGFEMTLPHSSMAYLGTAQSVSGSFLAFLQTMVVTGGVPELLPFIRYFSSFMDMEFGAIKSQDKGHGVVIAATWLMPMALVPRPWDYPTTTSPPVNKTSTSTDPPSKSPSFANDRIPRRLSSFQSSKRSPSPSSISSQERHATVNREAGITSAKNESMTNQSGSVLHQAPPLEVLASLEEVPEGSMRLKS